MAIIVKDDTSSEPLLFCAMRIPRIATAVARCCGIRAIRGHCLRMLVTRVCRAARTETFQQTDLANG